MSAEETPGAVAAHGAYVSDHRGRQVIGENNRQQTFARAPIRVTLIGFDRREAAGISVRGYAAVLDLCRELVAAGFDPACPLEAWRGQILCLRVRSIGQGARLTVADDRPPTFDAGRNARKGMPRARGFGKLEAPLPQHLHTRSSAGAGDNGEPKTHSRQLQDGSAEAFLAEGAGRTKGTANSVRRHRRQRRASHLGRQNREKING